MKVLYVLSSLSKQNGISSFVMNYYKHIDHNMFDFSFLVMNNTNGESEYEKAIEKNGDKIIVLPSLKKVVPFLKSLKHVFENEEYDIIHVHLVNLGWIFFLMSTLFSPNTKRVLHAHATVFGETKWRNIRNKFFAWFSIRLAQKLFACSKAAGDGLFGNRDYTVISNAIDVKEYAFDTDTRTKVRDQFECNRKIVIGTTARMEIQKNPLFAVDVFSEMLKYSDQMEYWWVGDGSLRKQVEEKVEKLGIQEKFKLLGKRSDARDLYQGMDLFMLPSLFEGLPVVAVEAEASGLPIVMSDSITREISSVKSKHISLACGAKVWAKEIYEWISDNQFEFQKRENLLRDTFDISVQTKVLEEQYSKLKISS